MKKSLKNIISLLLAVTVVLEPLGQTAYAADSNETPTISAAEKQENSVKTEAPVSSPIASPETTETPAAETPAAEAGTSDSESEPEISSEPEQTITFVNNVYSISSAEDLALLSQEEAADYQFITIDFGSLNTSTEYDLTKTNTAFLGLGSADYPFAGTIKVAQGGALPTFVLNRALFNSLSSSVSILSNAGEALPAGNVFIKAEQSSANQSNTQWVAGQCVLANDFAFASADDNVAWNVSLNKAADATTVVGGIIGRTRGANGTLNLGVTLKAYIEISSSNDAGIFVNRHEAGTVNIARLTFDSGAGTKVTGGSGYGAGSLFGYMGKDAAFAITQTGALSLNVPISGASNCGGLIGRCVVDESLSVDTSKYNLSTVSLSPASDGNAGALFGYLENQCSGDPAAAVTINGWTASSELNASAGSYGGLIGKYESTNIANTLSITGSATSEANQTAGNYGGIIGSVSGASYIELGIDDTDTPSISTIAATTSEPTNFGGLIGNIGDGCTVRANNATVKLGSADTVTSFSAGTAGGGVAGTIGVGSVLCLGGSTALTDAKPNTTKGGYGQIAGKQNRSLIFAESGWTLARQTSTVLIDDIGNYGEVIRLSGFDTAPIALTGHTVTLTSVSTQTAATAFTIADKNDFALLAIYIQSGGSFTPDGDLSKITISIDAAGISGDLTMTAAIDMTGTGVQGLLRDNGTQSYSGAFDGGGFALKLMVGEAYQPSAGSSDGKIFYHTHLGLFAKTSGTATVQNVIFNGTYRFNAQNTAYVGGAVGAAEGTLAFNNVSTGITANFAGNADTCVGGLAGKANGAGNVSFTGCTSSARLTSGSSAETSQYIGGFLGLLESPSGCGTLTFAGTNTLSGSIAVGACKDARVGGLIAGIAKGSNRSITLNNIVVSNQSVTVAASISGGGLLGYKWPNTNVTMSGVSVNGSSVSATAGGNFGGLVYQASGKWTISGLGVTNSNFTGSANRANCTDGLIVCHGEAYSETESEAKYALYLEVKPDGYALDNTVIITEANTNRFDELVGVSMSKLDGSSGQGVVSIPTAGNTPLSLDLDNNRNSYENRAAYAGAGITSVTVCNPNTRYYYNLDRIAGSTYSDLNNAEKLLLWSVYNYAHSTIKSSFASGATCSITGTAGAEELINLSGYSYYPIDYAANNSALTLSNVIITFDNDAFETMESATTVPGTSTTQEAVNKKPSDCTRQHYMMHGGLFRNVTSSFTLGSTGSPANITLKGSVGHTAAADANWTQGSGALICGVVTSGNVSNNTFTLSGIALSDLYVVGSKTASDYAPLLINKIATNPITISGKQEYGNINVSVSGITTTAAADGYYSRAGFAATSLIGDVGDVGATDIVMDFRNIVLDGRAAVNTPALDYPSSKAIFSRATLLNSFKYSTASSGTYNFNEEEDWDTAQTPQHVMNVTYGKEITSSIEFAGQEEHYYNKSVRNNKKNYVNCTTLPVDTEGSDFSQNYLPYVYDTAVNNSDYIENGLIKQDYVNYHELSVNIGYTDIDAGCGTYLHPYSITSADQLETVRAILAYTNIADDLKLLMDADGTKNCYGSGHMHYWKDGGVWKVSSNGTTWSTAPATITDEYVRRYVQNAYYIINENITLINFDGIGTEKYPFQGVIAGASDTRRTVTVNSTTGKNQRGGLIQYANGCVVKGINVAVSSCAIQPPTGNVETFFGGLIGVVVGGDVIIDDVTVTSFAAPSFGQAWRLASVGGCVGLVKAGGVIFRNMSASSLSTLTSAADYYMNPYIGRVLDGFAVSVGCDVNNTDKNYTIHRMNGSSGEFSVNDSAVSVSNAEELFVLSAIVNSGAASYDADAAAFTAGGYAQGTTYETRVRHAAYTGVGKGTGATADDTADCALAMQDDGGTGADFIPYLCRYYTSDGAQSRKLAMQQNVVVTLDGASCDMSAAAYKNGFRGIGARYSAASSQNVMQEIEDGLYLKISAFHGNGKTITLGMNVKEYSGDLHMAAGAGLFTAVLTGSTVERLTISGSALLNQYSASGTLYTNANNTSSVGLDAGVGGFAGLVTGANTFDHVTANALTVNGSRYTGGIVGYSDSNATVTLTDCGFNNIVAVSDQYAGGFVGKADGTVNIKWTDSSVPTGSSKIITCGKRTVNDNYYGCAGGLIGYDNNTEINNADDTVVPELTDICVYYKYEGTASSAVNFNGGSDFSQAIGGLIGTSKASATVKNIEIVNVTAVVTVIADLAAASQTSAAIDVSALSNPNKLAQFNGTTGANAAGVMGCCTGAVNLDRVDVYTAEGSKSRIMSNNTCGVFVPQLSNGASETITNCTVNGVTDANGTIYLQGKGRSACVTAFAQDKAGTITVNDCVFGSENGEIVVVANTHDSGGLFGNLMQSSNAVVERCILNNISVAAATNNGDSSTKKGNVGIIVGNMSNSGQSLKIADTSIINCTAVSNLGYCGTIAGESAGKINGYNIYWENNTLGQTAALYNVLDNNENAPYINSTLPTLSADNSKQAGTWVGTALSSSTIKLVGVTTQCIDGDGVNYTKPRRDVYRVGATQTEVDKPLSLSNSYIVYADYTGVTQAADAPAAASAVRNVVIPAGTAIDLSQTLSAGETASGWTSSSAGVAAVSGSVVTAVAEGSATVTATVAGETRTWNVRVTEGATGTADISSGLVYYKDSYIRQGDPNNPSNPSNKRSIDISGNPSATVPSGASNLLAAVPITGGKTYKITLDVMHNRFRAATYSKIPAKGTFADNYSAHAQDTNDNKDLNLQNQTIEITARDTDTWLFLSFWSSGTTTGTKYSVPVITVEEQGVQVAAQAVVVLASKNSFVAGESLKQALKVYTQQSGENTLTQVQDYSVSGYNSASTGSQTVTVSCGGISTSFDVTVVGRMTGELGYTLPTVTTSPVSELTLVSANGALTGDGVCFSTGTTGIAELIADDINNQTAGSYYTGCAGGTSLPTTLAMRPSETTKLSDYNSTGQTPLTGGNIPVLVLDMDNTLGSGENATHPVNEAVVNALDLLSNGGYSQAVAAGALNPTNESDVTIKTYVSGGDGTWSVLQNAGGTEIASVSYDDTEGVGYRVGDGMSDSGNDRFTLLTVHFKEQVPTGSTARVYDLQLPIIVKHPIEVTFTSWCAEGTELLKTVDERTFSNNTSLDPTNIVNYGGDCTLFLRYSYDYTWADIENYDQDTHISKGLNWNYSKRLNMTTEGYKELPAGTRVTLIDLNEYENVTVDGVTTRKKLYGAYSCVLAADTQMIDLDSLTFESNADEHEWQMLSLAELYDHDNGVCADEEYLLILDFPEGDDSDTRSIEINAKSAEKLSIVSYDSANSKTVPSSVTTAGYGMCAVYKDVEQTLYIGTSGGTHDGTILNNVEVEPGYNFLNEDGNNTIDVYLDEMIGYNPALATTQGISRFLDFKLSLRDENGIVQIDEPYMITASFTAYEDDAENPGSLGAEITGIDGMPDAEHPLVLNVDTSRNQFTVPYATANGSYYDVMNILRANPNLSGVHIVAHLQIEFYKQAMGTFPEAEIITVGNKRVPETSVQFSATARISSDSDSMASGRCALAGEKEGTNEYKLQNYYLQPKSRLSLAYNYAWPRLDKLGINPKDTDDAYDTEWEIHTQGIVTVAEQNVVTDCYSMECRLTLQRKGDDGQYHNVTSEEPLTFLATPSLSNAPFENMNPIGDSPTFEGNTDQSGWRLTVLNSPGTGSTINDIHGFYNSDDGVIVLPILLKINNTGTNYFYANYRVKLQVILHYAGADQQPNTADDTTVESNDDFVIYTYAKINTDVNAILNIQ